MICNKCQQDLLENKFVIKYYRKDWSPYRRKTCETCRWKFTQEYKDKKNKSRRDRYHKTKVIKVKPPLSEEEVEKKIKRFVMRTHVKYLKWTPWQNFLTRCYNRLNKVRTKYWIENIVTKKIRPQYIHEEFKRQDSKCPLCRKQLDINDWKTYEIDHIIPFSVWWWHEENNIQFLCPECHHIKSWYEAYDITPSQ